MSDALATMNFKTRYAQVIWTTRNSWLCLNTCTFSELGTSNARIVTVCVTEKRVIGLRNSALSSLPAYAERLLNGDLCLSSSRRMETTVKIFSLESSG